MPLSPFIDQHGILRVGCRLDKNGQGDGHLHPVIMPKNHYLTRLLVRKFHHQVLHQGRLLTAGALRSGGFWVVGAKNLIRSEIKSCVTCHKLRGSFGWQKMADLPEDRIQLTPPFYLRKCGHLWTLDNHATTDQRMNCESEEMGLDVYMPCFTSSSFGSQCRVVHNFIYQCITQVHSHKRPCYTVSIRSWDKLHWGSA